MPVSMASCVARYTGTHIQPLQLRRRVQVAQPFNSINVGKGITPSQHVCKVRWSAGVPSGGQVAVGAARVGSRCLPTAPMYRMVWSLPAACLALPHLSFNRHSMFCHPTYIPSLTRYKTEHQSSGVGMSGGAQGGARLYGCWRVGDSDVGGRGHVYLLPPSCQPLLSPRVFLPTRTYPLKGNTSVCWQLRCKRVTHCTSDSASTHD